MTFLRASQWLRWFGSYFKGIFSRYKQCKKYPMPTYLVNAAFSKWWLFIFYFCSIFCLFVCLSSLFLLFLFINIFFFFVSFKYICLWVRLFFYAYKTKLEKTKCLAWKPLANRHWWDVAANGSCQCVCCVCIHFLSRFLTKIPNRRRKN